MILGFASLCSAAGVANLALILFVLERHPIEGLGNLVFWVAGPFVALLGVSLAAVAFGITRPSVHPRRFRRVALLWSVAVVAIDLVVVAAPPLWWG